MMTTSISTPFSVAVQAGLSHLAQLPPPTDSSLFSGQLGHVLLYAYAYKFTAEELYWDKLMLTLENVLHKLQEPAASQLLTQPGLLPNLGYVLHVIKQDDIANIDLGEETLTQFDDLIFRHALFYLRGCNIDFLYGATGAIHYLGTRVAARPHVAAYLEELFDELLKTKIEDERGIRFYNTHINYLNGNSDLNLGLAHGHCGLLLVLLELHKAGLLQARIAPVASRMVDYLLTLEMPPEPTKGWVSYFPARHHDDLPLHDAQNRGAYNNRMGWCYGDLNVVQVLYQAHQVLHRPELLTVAHRVGEHTCTRQTEATSGITDPFLCHGSASLVLYYRRLHQLHQLPCYREAHHYWQQRMLEQLPATYLLGPDAFQITGLLMGLPGLLLVLISEALDEPLAWPQLFLL